MKTARLLLIVSVICLASACSGIKSTQIIKSAGPYHGAQTIDMQPATVYKTDELLFLMTVQTRTGMPDSVACAYAAGRLPEGALMREVQQRGAELGANHLLFDCGSPGTVGACLCTVRGYRR